MAHMPTKTPSFVSSCAVRTTTLFAPTESLSHRRNLTTKHLPISSPPVRHSAIFAMSVSESSPSISAPARSLLVIGAGGRVGKAVINAADQQTPPVAVHALLRDAAKLPADLAARCASVTSADGADADAVSRALATTSATDVVLCTGAAPDPDGAILTVRTDTARALAKAVTECGGKTDDTGSVSTMPRTVVVSSLGASGSPIRFGWGRGLFVRWVLRKPLKDHDGQEAALRAAYSDAKKSLLIVRPTGLTEDKATGEVQIMDDGVADVWSIDRADLADWILKQICGDGDFFGDEVGITGIAQKKEK